MDNSNKPLEESTQTGSSKTSWSLIAIIVAIIVVGVAWQFTGSKPESVEKIIPAQVIEPEQESPVEILEPVIEMPEIEIEVEEEVITPVENPLPALDESDDWLKLKLLDITWRKELLTLIIDDDMIRRFVVFTDNFSQGIVAYEHSPFTLPKVKFTPESDSVSFQETVQDQGTSKGKQNVWQWNESSSKRFSLYVDLLRSMDSNSLVQWYFEVKPLIDEAYKELGYEDDFTNTLQDAITRVLDMELPNSPMTLIQPSVTYKFSNHNLESLADTN